MHRPMLFGATKMEHRMMAAMQNSQENARLRLRPTLSDTKPTAMFEAMAATLFHVWRATESACE